MTFFSVAISYLWPLIFTLRIEKDRKKEGSTQWKTQDLDPQWATPDG